VIDRAGNKPVLAICAAGIATLPLLWLTARPEFIYPIWFIAVWAGFTWAGFGLATFTLPLVLSPRLARNYYVAAMGIATGVCTFAASTLGGVIAQHYGDTVWEVAGVTFINYHFLFVLSAGGRFLSIILLRFVKEPRDAGVPAAIALVRGGLARRFAAAGQLFAELAWPWRRHD